MQLVISKFQKQLLECKSKRMGSFDLKAIFSHWRFISSLKLLCQQRQVLSFETSKPGLD